MQYDTEPAVAAPDIWHLEGIVDWMSAADHRCKGPGGMQVLGEGAAEIAAEPSPEAED